MMEINGIEYLTTNEVAKIRNVSQQTVLMWIKLKSNPLPAIKMGEGRRAQYLINIEDLEKYRPKPIGRPTEKKL